MPPLLHYQASDNPYQRYINFAARLGINTIIPPFRREVTEHDLYFLNPPPLYGEAALDTPPGYISRRPSAVPSDAPPDYSSRRASEASFISNGIPRRPSSAPSMGSLAQPRRASSIISGTEITEHLQLRGLQVERRATGHEGLHLARPAPPGVPGHTRSVVEMEEREEEEDEEYEEDEDEEDWGEEPVRENREEQAAAPRLPRLYPPPAATVTASDSAFISRSAQSTQPPQPSQSSYSILSPETVDTGAPLPPLLGSSTGPTFRLDIFNTNISPRFVQTPNVSPRGSVYWNLNEPVDTARGVQTLPRRPTDDLIRLRNLGRRMLVVESRRSSRSSVYFNTELARVNSESAYGRQRRPSTPVGPADPRVYEIDHEGFWEDEEEDEGETGSTASGPRSAMAVRAGDRLEAVAEEATESDEEEARVEGVPEPRFRAGVSHDNIGEVGAECVHREQQVNDPQVIRIPEPAVVRQRGSGAIVFEVRWGNVLLEVPYGPGTRVIDVQPPRHSMAAARSGWDDTDLESGMGVRIGSTVSRRREVHDEVESVCHCTIM
ncbi:hypothetical protein FPQ18DRAFT_389773 [Pyronema domesticum]|nr:hypothetical protein FPQ18DRAFT_389773 [Pyronema domesticum]